MTLFVLIFSCYALAQEQEEGFFQNISIRSGFGFEYFSRTITWDEDKYSSKLKSYFFTFNTEFELQNGLSMNAFLGYSLSNYDSLMFRKLPFSIELEAGEIGGFIFGGEIKKSVIRIKDLSVEGLGQFSYYLGTRKEWEIPGLNVTGTVEGKPSWIRVAVGPVFIYKGSDSFYPYLYLSYNKLWGTFKMDQTVEDLKGSENKEISEESSFSSSLGTIYKITDTFSIKGEASLIPRQNGIDLGFMLRAMYSF